MWTENLARAGETLLEAEPSGLHRMWQDHDSKQTTQSEQERRIQERLRDAVVKTHSEREVAPKYDKNGKGNVREYLCLVLLRKLIIFFLQTCNNYIRYFFAIFCILTFAHRDVSSCLCNVTLYSIVQIELKPKPPIVFMSTEGGGNQKVRYRDGQVVSHKGEKVRAIFAMCSLVCVQHYRFYSASLRNVTAKQTIIIKNPHDDYDGGSRGMVKPKGKRGPGWIKS